MNEMINSNEKYKNLINSIEDIVNNAKSQIAKSINNTMVETYWNIGKYIIEYEQNGNIKAEYGKSCC